MMFLVVVAAASVTVSLLTLSGWLLGLFGFHVVAGPGRCVTKPFPCGCWTRAVCDKAETVISRLHMGEGTPVRTPCEKLLTVGHKIS